MSGARSRRKGHDWERKLVRWFKGLGFQTERNLTETRQGSSGDIIVECLCPNFHSPSDREENHQRLVVECKHQKSPRPWAALDQAVKAVGDDITNSLPVAIVKQDRKPAQVWLNWHDAKRWGLPTTEGNGSEWEFRSRKPRKNSKQRYVFAAYITNLEAFERWITESLIQIT